MNIFQQVKAALNTISPAVPFAMAPYKTSGDLPDTYLAYQLITGTPEQHADDEEMERSYSIQISIFSRGGLVSLPDVDTAMTDAGFQKGPERQLPQDRETGHYGLAKDYVYTQTKE
jgi:hypothetical protein